PASCSVKMPMICSSENLDRFIVRPFVGSDSSSKWRKNPVAGQSYFSTWNSTSLILPAPAGSRSVQCFLDSDEAGVKAVAKATSDSILRQADYNLINVQGQKEAELEDLLDAKKYKAAFYSEFEVDPTIVPPGAKGQKWSVAMEKKFLAHGKLWNDMIESQVKIWIANFAKSNIDDIVIEARFSQVDAFAKSLINKLQAT
ncbi:hypothetical protein, partial [Roseovarius sp. A46]|uniref:hypothetical protein n=1 Tax=Roseovarius sp. A46 TaxID=2109331 RepID=UPI0019D6EC71